LPAIRASQVEEASKPTGHKIPVPVTTTLLLIADTPTKL